MFVCIGGVLFAVQRAAFLSRQPVSRPVATRTQLYAITRSRKANAFAWRYTKNTLALPRPAFFFAWYVKVMTLTRGHSLPHAFNAPATAPSRHANTQRQRHNDDGDDNDDGGGICAREWRNDWRGSELLCPQPHSEILR